MGRYVLLPTHRERGLMLMYVTFNDLFTFVIMLAAVITLVINFKHKK